MLVRPLAALTAALLIAAPASAITIVPNPIPLVGSGDFGSIVASIELVATVTGIPAGGSVSFGTVSPTDTTLVFRASVDLASDPVMLFGMGADDDGALPLATIPFSGAGEIAGAGVDIELFDGRPGEESVAVYQPALEAFAPGSVLDLFFVSYAIPPGIGEFLTAGAGTTLEDLPLPVQTHAMVVPEAGTAALLGLGLAALGRRPACDCA